MICDTLSRTPLCPTSEARDAPFQFCTIAELPSQNQGLIVTPTIGAQVLLGAVPAFRSANDGKSLTSTHAALDIFNRLTEGRDIACLKRKDSRVRIENSGLVPRVCGHRHTKTLYILRLCTYFVHTKTMYILRLSTVKMKTVKGPTVVRLWVCIVRLRAFVFGACWLLSVVCC